MDRAHLDRDLLAAHASGDAASLIQLYTQAADLSEMAGDVDATCFYLTHAFVFALEAGAPEVALLNQRLVAHSRAHPLVTRHD